MFIMMNSKIVNTFKQIGLTSKHALVYEALSTEVVETPLSLARKTKINRSSLYRYLEDLRGRGLTELVMRGRASGYRLNLEGFDLYLVKEEARLESLRKAIPSLVEMIKTTRATDTTEVKHFQGKEGLRQMLWNVVASGTEFVGLGFENWNTSVGKEYAEKLRTRIIETQVRSREILNETSRDFQYTSRSREYQNYYQHRAISPTILDIKYDTYIYAEVFAFYYHFRGEYFGVEIHNKLIASAERQMFEILWKIAR